jgi:hypothetical protein
MDRVHPETVYLGVSLRSEATKNLVDTDLAEILRSAQNDLQHFPDGL